MEGGVFLCSWKKTRDGFRVWWTERPSIAAQGETFDEADEALCEAIGAETGDGENLHEYDPPPPRAISNGMLPIDVVKIGGECFARIANPEELFSDGFCPHCLQPRGRRTDAPLALSSTQSRGGNGGMALLEDVGLGGPAISFVSDAFIDLMTPAERAAAEWREIASPPRSRKRFFELVGAPKPIAHVALAGVPRKGWSCRGCGHASGAFYGDGDPPFWYISASDLPTPTPSVFVVGERPTYELAFTRTRWRELLREKGTAGCKSYMLGVVSESRVDRAPQLPQRLRH